MNRRTSALSGSASGIFLCLRWRTQEALQHQAPVRRQKYEGRRLLSGLLSAGAGWGAAGWHTAAHTDQSQQLWARQPC